MADWVPKTRLGQMVLNGEIPTMSDALATKLPLREPQIVDILLPELQDEVIDLNMVQFPTIYYLNIAVFQKRDIANCFYPLFPIGVFLGEVYG